MQWRFSYCYMEVRIHRSTNNFSEAYKVEDRVRTDLLIPLKLVGEKTGSDHDKSVLTL